MIRLSAFADEISPDLEEQLAVLHQEGIRYLELRSVDNVNVLDLDDLVVQNLKQSLQRAGVRVSSIGSPLGKVSIAAPWDQEAARMDRAIELALAFDTPYIRIFSFYPPELGERDPSAWRDQVLSRLETMTRRAATGGITLLHENETSIYGDSVERCVDLLRSVNSPHLRAVLDPANFIQCGEAPYPDAYLSLKPWIAYVHVKDAVHDNVVVAGEGGARWPALLRQLHLDGYEGFFSLEPHLAAAGQFSGFSGPDLFRRASAAFRDLLQLEGWEHG